MRKLLWAFLFFGVVLLGLYLRAFIPKTEKKEIPKKEKLSDPAKGKERQITTLISKSIFVPYWSLDEEKVDVKEYERMIYFGIAATTNGLEKNDLRFKNIEEFNNLVPQNKIKYLTLVMTNSDVNFSVLESLDLQEKIIDETIVTAKQYHFSGIVLDFELFSLFDEKIPGQINDFVQKFYKKAKEENLTFVLTIYGDVFYRKRPYDVSFLAKNSDEIMIMAYDFHKSIGEPGPNFPLPEFKTMLDDFLKVAPREKISVVFGMYGYDWIVDEKKRPLKKANSLSLNQISDKYLKTCSFKNCVRFRDKTSSESEINFVDDFGQSHIIWFEDKKSVEEKTKFLQEKGIGRVIYWAYGYF